MIVQEEGIIRPVAAARKLPGEVHPELGPVLERLLFKALLAEDGQGDGHTPEALRSARWDFLARAVEAGLTVAMAASALGIQTTRANDLLRSK